MNGYDLGSLRLLTCHKHEQRLREAGAERLARELRGTSPRRGWRRLRVSPPAPSPVAPYPRA